MTSNMNSVVRVVAAVLVSSFALGTLTACGGGSANSHPVMPKELSGLDVVIGPGAAVTGEGAGTHPDFGGAMVSAVESRLLGEGFDVVQPDHAQHAVRVQIQANLTISRNAFLQVNGKPLESNNARVQVRVLTAEGALLDSFEVEGSPDTGTADEVAARLADRMKGSKRLIAIAKEQPETPPGALVQPGQAVAAAGGTKKALVATSQVPSTWPDVSKQLRDQKDGERDAAVIVAIERYAELIEIPGAVANGEAWFRYLVDTRGVPRGNVQMLINEAARDQQIRKAVEEAGVRAQRGGKLWFVFIGHGAPSSDNQGLLVGFDAYQTAEGIADRSVKTNELLKDMSLVQATPVVVLDACFSGRSTTGKALVAGLQPTTVVKTNAPASALVLTAAQSNQFAGPLPGGERPAFSYLALGALRGWADKDENGNVTAKEVEQYVGDTLRVLLAGTRQQTPTLEGQRGDFVLSKAIEKEPRAIIAALQVPRAEP
jgi:hypothetical protein